MVTNGSAVEFEWDREHPLVSSGVLKIYPSAGTIKGNGGIAVCKMTLRPGFDPELVEVRVVFVVVFVVFALFIDLLTDKVQPLSRPTCRVEWRSCTTGKEVREIGLYCTCWLYSLCNFQYRQQYENTCSYNFEC